MASTRNICLLVLFLTCLYWLVLSLSFLGGVPEVPDPCNAPPNSTFYQKCNISEPESDLTEQFPSLVPCTSSNWSGGSAFFTLMALGFGYYAHPSGCSFFQRAGRMWRLNIAWVAFEALVLVLRVINGIRWKYSLHSVCYTVLAVRAGNGLRQSEIERLIEEKFGGPRHDEDEDTELQQLLSSPGVSAALDSISATQSSEESPVVLSSSGPSSNSIMQTTAGLPTGVVQDEKTEEDETSQQEQGEQPERGLTQATRETHKQSTLEVETSPSVAPSPSILAPALLARGPPIRASAIIKQYSQARRIEELEDTVFVESLRTVASYESGPTFRVFIFIPMLFQAAKLITSTSRGFHPYLCWIYFAAFFIEELLLIAVARRPLTHKERREAIELSRNWRRLAAKEHNDRDYKRRTNVSSAPLGWGIALGFFTGFYSLMTMPGLVAVSFPENQRGKYRWFHNPNHSFFVALLGPPKLVVLTIGALAYGATIFLPWPLMVVQWLLMLAWEGVGGKRRYGPLALEFSWGNFITLLPVWVAGTAALLQLLAYAGAYKDPKYNYVCKGTYAPPYYDWLG